MARLPIPGSDQGQWGDILNDYLSVSLDTDGTIKANAIDGASVQNNSITQSKLSASSAAAGRVLTTDGTNFTWTTPAASAGDATASDKGVVQLAGDLAGTAELPTVPGLASKASDSAVVHKATAEAITGAKDFTGGITVNGTGVVVTSDSRLSDTRTPTDGSVTDAKVAASAAIAASKIAGLSSVIDEHLGGTSTGLLQSDGKLSFTVASEAVARVLQWVIVTEPQFGADRTGATSSVAAFEAVITYVNLTGSRTIYLPPGTYDLTAGITQAITRNYVNIVGAGPGSTRLRVENGTLFKWTAAAIGGGLSNVDAYCSATLPDTQQRLIDIDGASSQKFERIFLDNVCQLARLGSVSGGSCSAPSFRHVYGNTAPIAGAIVIDAVKGFSLSINDVVVSLKGVGYVSDRTSLHPAPIGATFLRFGKGSWDTAHVSEVTTNRYDYGLDMLVESIAVVSNMWFYGCVFDYCKSRGMRLRVGSTGAYIGSIVFTGGWAVAQDGYSVEVFQTVSGGIIEHIDFTNVTAQQAGKSNWRLSAAVRFDGVRLLNCRGLYGNRLSGNAFNDCIDLVILGGGVTVEGGRFGDPNPGGAWQPTYGVLVGANRAARVKGVMAKGATGGWVIEPYTAADTRSLVSENRVDSATARPDYTLASGLITTPTSGASQTQLQPTRDLLYVFGGTVTDIRHNAVGVGTTGPATLTLSPGDTWSVTYSSAPIIKRMIQP